MFALLQGLLIYNNLNEVNVDTYLLQIGRDEVIHPDADLIIRPS
jgi:hypothetical protein